MNRMSGVFARTTELSGSESYVHTATRFSLAMCVRISTFINIVQ